MARIFGEFFVATIPQNKPGLGLPSLQMCVVKCLVKFDLKFEISDGKNIF